MNWYEILIIVGAAAFVVGIAVWQIVRRMKGKGGCDCGGDCTHCAQCRIEKEKKADHSKEAKRS